MMIVVSATMAATTEVYKRKSTYLISALHPIGRC